MDVGSGGALNLLRSIRISAFMLSVNALQQFPRLQEKSEPAPVCQAGAGTAAIRRCID